MLAIIIEGVNQKLSLGVGRIIAFQYLFTNLTSFVRLIFRWVESRPIQMSAISSELDSPSQSDSAQGVATKLPSMAIYWSSGDPLSLESRILSANSINTRRFNAFMITYKKARCQCAP